MKIERILFWMFTVVAIVLLLWLIFGDSPTELFVSSIVGGVIVTKMWSIREKQVKLELGTKNDFNNMKKDMDLIKQNLSLIKKRLSE